MYVYNATIVAVYDGDTVRANIDLGFSIHTHSVQLRLQGINAPEMRGDSAAAGLLARDALRTMVLGKAVTINTFKDKQEKYGRYLAEIFCDGVNVNEWLVSNGYAVKYMETA